MSVVVVEDLSLMLGGKSIVDGLGFRIGEQDRIGLIGPNGSGKTTILRLLAGEQAPDGGVVRGRKLARVGYLPQDVALEGGRSLMTFIRESVPGRQGLEESLKESEAELEALTHDTEAPDYEERMLETAGRVGQLHEQLAIFEMQYSDHAAMQILAGLGFKTEDHDRDIGELSGGWKMRAVLTSLLFQRPDLLLLDEPTNHLDMPSVAWLSAFLKRYNKAFVLISHDREFLNEQIDRVISFEPEGVRQYKGDLDQYERQRAEEKVLLENRAKNVQRQKEQLERFVKRFKAKASKASQARSKMKQLEKLEDVELHQDRSAINFRFPPTERAGKIVLEVQNLQKSYGDLEVLKGANLKVKRGARIALLGVNGAGKTTLLRILAGEIEKSGGDYEFGHKTKVGYYAQHHAEALDKSKTVYDAVASCAKDASHTQIRSVLGAMLFGEREVDKQVGVLSGGERARVALAQLLIDPGNVLLMDEPTNHLDLVSSERLAEALDTFDGTLLFVSHNRSFIRHLAQSIWFVKDGKVEVYPGTFDDYMHRFQSSDRDPWDTEEPKKSQKKSEPKPAKNVQVEEPRRGNDKQRRKAEAAERRARNKKLRPLQRRASELEATIARLEKEQAERTQALSDPTVYEDAAKQTEINQAYQRAQAELEVAMEAWTEVQEELESLQGSAS